MFDLMFDGLLMLFRVEVGLALVIGMIVGLIVGAVPGLTSSIGIALFIPITYGMDPLVALVFFAGLDTAACYGGAIPAILLRIPGTPGAICTTLDGAPMAEQGHAVAALKIAAAASAAGAFVGALFLLFLSPPLARLALSFGPSEIFWLNVLGLSTVAMLVSDDPLKGLIAATLGLLLGTVGTDAVTGFERFTFGSLNLIEGLPTAIVLVGMFALPAAWRALEEVPIDRASRGHLFDRLVRRPFVYPLRRLASVIARSSVVGVIIGILPGVGGTAAAFIAYNEARRTAPDPSAFGKGDPAGVAAPEASNAAENGGALIPALTLGIPGSASSAVMMGALIVHGMQPGPDLFSDPEGTIWGYMWAMVICAVGILMFGGALATRVFGQVLRLPTELLMPMILVTAFVGTYALTAEMFDAWLMFACGVGGYLLRHTGFPAAPLILGLILGAKAESALRTALLLGQGDPSVLFRDPLSLALVAMVAFVLLYPLVARRRAQLSEE